MEHSKAVCFRLISEDLSEVDHHCSLCLFLHDQTNGCQHAPATRSLPRSATPFSDCSFYSCQSAVTAKASKDSMKSYRSNSSGSSSSTIKAPVRFDTLPTRQRSLRRRQSPIAGSLRELHCKQSCEVDLRLRRSEEQLQAVYERQILQYLNSNSSLDPGVNGGDLSTIEECWIR